jgi:ABC-type sugar transport system substrate-binding protein
MEQAAKAVEVLAGALKGEPVPPENITPLRLITKSDVDRFRPAY